MRRRTLTAVAIGLVVLLSAFAGGMAAASENAQFDGKSADTADQTDTTYIDEGTDLNNVTISMTEDQSISAGGSVTFDTAHTASDATVVSSSGSGTLEVTVNSDTVVVSETGGSSSATLEELQITFNVVDSVDEDGIPAVEDEVMNSSAELVSDNDNSEIHSYYIYDAEDMVDVTYEFTNGNYSDGAYSPESTGEETEMTVEVTRNDTVHEDIPLEYAKVVLEFNENQMDNVTDDTNTSAQNITQDDVAEAGDYKKYVYSIDNQNATGENDTYTMAFSFEPTTEVADEPITVTTQFDPKGGVESEHETAIDFGSEGEGLSFYDIYNVPTWALALGGLVLVGGLAGVILYRDESDGLANLGGIAFTDGGAGVAISLVLLLGGFGMVLDSIVGAGEIPVVGMQLNVFTDLVTSFGLPAVSPLFIGTSLIGLFVYLNRSMMQ